MLDFAYIAGLILKKDRETETELLDPESEIVINGFFYQNKSLLENTGRPTIYDRSVKESLLMLRNLDLPTRNDHTEEASAVQKTILQNAIKLVI